MIKRVKVYILVLRAERHKATVVCSDWRDAIRNNEQMQGRNRTRFCACYKPQCKVLNLQGDHFIMFMAEYT